MNLSLNDIQIPHSELIMPRNNLCGEKKIQANAEPEASR